MNYTKEQISEIISKHAVQRNGLNDLLSIMLEKNFKSIIHTLSAGNILTLGFHPIVIAAIGRHGGYIDYVTSFFILISFFPIIQLTRMYFPYILGIRKFNKI